MGRVFSGKELIDVAIGIEKNGVAYYGSLADSSSDSEIKGMYRQLAEQEKKHIQIFQTMLGNVGDYQPLETYPEEYSAYLKALTDSAVFTSDQSARDTAKKVSSATEAINIGLTAEKDSILFYSEMRDLVKPAERDTIDNIIQEEKMHMRQLNHLKSTLRQ